MRNLVLVSVLLISTLSLCQNNEPRWQKFDSLKRVAARMPDDTSKLEVISSMLKEITAANPDTGLHYAQIGLEIARRIHAQYYLGKYFSYIANYNTGAGEYDKALQYNLAAVGQYDSIADSVNLARCIMNSGNVLYHQKKFTEAKKYHTEALDIYNALGLKKGIADCYMNLSNDFWELGMKDTSIGYLELSLAVRREINDQRGIAQSLHNLGYSYMEMEQFSRAEQYFREALAMKENLGDTFSMAFTYAGLANLALKQEKFNDAITLSESTIKLTWYSSNRRVRKGAYQVMALSYAGLGDYKNAYEYHLKYSQLNDSLYTADSDKNIAEMKTKYESDKKERANQLLQKEKEIAELESKNKDNEIERRGIMIWTAIAGLVIAIVLGVIILKAYRDKKKANLIISAQKAEVEMQKSLVEDKQKDILDSINYAKRIQKSFLPSRTDFRKSFREHFVFFRPRDVVSGDFYTLDHVKPNSKRGRGKLTVVTAVDCTGHGVPGALMSIVGNTLLNQTIKDPDVNTPADALNFLNRELPKNLMKHEKEEIVRDGMDMVMCAFDLENLEMHSAGAINPVYIVRNGELMEIKGDRHAISGFSDDAKKSFNNITTPLKKDDCIYLFTDGYADQFGGVNGKKYKYNRFKELLVRLSPLPMEEQRAQLKEEFLSWKGNFEQVDDVLVIGIKI